MLLAVVPTRTKIVTLQVETFIKTTSKSTCHKPPQQITTKETPVSDLRWLQIKFDLPVFLPIKIIKTTSIGGTISIKIELVNQAPAYQAPIPQTQSVTQTDFESYIKANDAVLRNMQNQGQNVQNQCQRLQTQIINLTDMLSKFMSSNTASSSGSGALPRPIIPTPSKVVKQGTKVTKDQVQTPSSQSTAPVQPLVIQSEIQTPVSKPVVAPVSVPMPNLKSSIPYPSSRDNERCHDQANEHIEKFYEIFKDISFEISFTDALILMKQVFQRCRDQANEHIEKFYEIFKDISFEISFTDALILMPKFASTLKALIGNKEKLSEMARTPMNEHCSAVILNKLPSKLGDPGKFLIPCEFPRMDECLALADLGSGTLPGNTITNPKEYLKGITTRSGVAYQGPTIPTPSKVVKQGTEVTKDQVQTPSSQSTAPVQPPVTQSETSVSEPVVAPVSVPMPNLKPSIPYPSRRNNERSRGQANEQIEKLYEIFKDMSFEISFTDALILMPKFASTIKVLIGNKEKLSEMARTLMNEHCSAVILNKLPKKLKDPGKFFIPCEFPRMDECLALADLADFVVVDFEPDPRVTLILGRYFLKTSRALIEIYKGELTLRIRNEAITYNLDQTSRYSANYDQMTANKIDVTDEAYEEYSQEVLGFFDVTTSGSPTPSADPIVSTTSPTLTSFGDSNFLLFEEDDAFLGLEDDPDSPEFDPSYYDPEGDFLLLEAILNSEPSPSLRNHEQFVPSFKNELTACEAKTIKSSVDEPPEVKL
nr:reverse transcriptase domain-containing protein [Tanacetum cinerariifolium]